MSRPPQLDWTTFAAVVCGLLSAALLLAMRPNPHAEQAHQYAAAAVRGWLAGPRPDADALEDEATTNDANEAGYRWAEQHGLDDEARCPAYSVAFHAGCVAFIREGR